MRKYLLPFLFILFLSNTSAKYYNSDTMYCERVINSNDFLTVCPSDYRDDNNPMLVKHFTTEYSMAKCVNGELIYEYCNFTLLPWKHPNVVGEPSWSQFSISSTSQTTQSEIPEFNTITAIIALIGAGIVAYRMRR
jgi:hypothetical protein